ncbi:type II secretion system F family protein [Kineococcus sp. SYSU DK003]|uniref:type II secretion system F family protein n=1 Tax=Kineococcus sp. SYSU DK003 TaxID=3383124 RepID=UPI003D7CB10D
MTPLVVLLGALAGLGLILLLREFIPQQARLSDALQRLDTTPALTGRPRPNPGADDGPQVKLGHWLERRLPARLRGQMLGPDLALLQRSSAHFLGEKALTALVGLMCPIVLTLTLSLMNTALGSTLSLPFVVPAAAALALAAIGFMLPDAQLKQRAAVARAEFSRAVGAYIELVALERRASSGTTQALERAAELSDSWVFRRIREELRLARISGVPAWDNLKDFSSEIAVSELADLADIMRLAGTQNAAIADNLHARSRSLRNALLNREKALANADSERAVLPVAALGLIFVTLLAVPAALQIIG